MKIYVAHSRSFDFKKELYEPIRQSYLNNEHIFVLPHETSDEPFNSQDYLKNEANLMIAEVSKLFPGLETELEWADNYKVPIIYIYRTGSNISDSLKITSKRFIEYSNSKELILELKKQFILFNCKT